MTQNLSQSGVQDYTLVGLQGLNNKVAHPSHELRNYLHDLAIDIDIIVTAS